MGRESIRGGSAALLRGGAQAALVQGKFKSDLVKNAVNLHQIQNPNVQQVYESIVEEASAALGIDLDKPLDEVKMALVQASFSIFSPTVAAKVKDTLKKMQNA